MKYFIYHRFGTVQTTHYALASLARVYYIYRREIEIIYIVLVLVEYHSTTLAQIYINSFLFVLNRILYYAAQL